MISYEEAIQKVREALPMPRIESRALEEVFGYVLAKDIQSEVNDPPFDKTAVDGYALGEADYSEGSEFKVVSSIGAGDLSSIDLGPGQCARIFTGAMVPQGTVTVVMQEEVDGLNSDVIRLTKDQSRARHIRWKGEQIKVGDIALSKGKSLNPGTLGLLSGLGITKVEVYSKPKIGIMITGNEFAQTKAELEKGKIFDSNKLLLEGLLNQRGIQSELRFCPDDPEELQATFNELSQKHNVVIVTGGVSVGDHDHTPKIIEKAGFQIQFHKVAQKPGKPVLFAKRETDLCFGLPGNPLSVFVCFQLYVVPALRRAMGYNEEHQTKAKILHDHENKSIRREFALCRLNSSGVQIMRDRSSHMLKGLVDANALCLLEPKQSYIMGDSMNVIPFV